ncbi:uncharacterized protein LOC144074822 [Stigmatopora argus]
MTPCTCGAVFPARCRRRRRRQRVLYPPSRRRRPPREDPDRALRWLRLLGALLLAQIFNEDSGSGEATGEHSQSGARHEGHLTPWGPRAPRAPRTAAVAPEAPWERPSVG